MTNTAYVAIFMATVISGSLYSTWKLYIQMQPISLVVGNMKKFWINSDTHNVGATDR